MTRIFTENFESGAAGAAVTNANTTFDLAPTAGAVFTSSPVAVGSRAITVSTDTTAASRILQRNLGSLRSLLFAAIYVYVPASPAANVFIGSINTGATVRAGLRINTDRTAAIRNGAIAVYTSTLALPIGWSRLEWRLDQVAGQQQLRGYLGANLHGTTPDFDSGSQTFNTGTFDVFQTGFATAVASVTLGFDWVALDDATWVGAGAAPPNTPPTVNAGADQINLEPWATVTLTGTDSDGDGTIASRAWAQTGGPAVSLTGSGAARTFEAPGTLAGTTLTFQYSATDDDGATATDTMTVTVLPVTERAVIGGVEVPMRIRET